MGLALMKSSSEKEDKYMPTAVLSKRAFNKKKRNGRIGTETSIGGVLLWEELMKITVFVKYVFQNK